MRRGLSVLLCLLPAQGCLRPDPAHCANRAGDDTCAQEGAAAFCSICSSQNNGCVDEEPGPNCYMPVGATVGVDGTGDTTSPSTESDAGPESSDTEPTSTTEPIDCTQDGPDPDCPQSLPFCIGGTCSACSAGDAALCATANPDTPVCHSAWGACVGCVESEDCTDAVCGDDYTCVECTRHDDCPGTACDLEQRQCMVTNGVFYVDPTGCPPPGNPTDDPGFGSQLQPYCWLVTALDNAPSFDTAVIFLSQGSANQIEEDILVDNIGDVTVAIVGVDRPTITGADTPVVAGGGATIYVHNMELSNAGGTAVTCGGQARLWLTDVEITDSNTAIDADNCDQLTVERSLIADNSADAIRAGGSAVTLVSSAVVNNGAPAGTSALSVTSSQLDIRYTTFAHNQGLDGAGASVSCSGAEGEVRNSIIASPSLPSIDCAGVTVSYSAVDTETEGDGVVVLTEYTPDWFASVFGQDVSPADPDNSPFADVARWDTGDPLRDFRGGRRGAFPGLREFAGAIQP